MRSCRHGRHSSTCTATTSAPRGGRAPVAALVKLLAPLGIAPPAVRTAVSRMVRQGWLDPLRLASGPGYSITPKAARRLDEAAARIYRTGRITWDGRFDLLVLATPTARRDRQRLAANLSFLGYGTLDEQHLGGAPGPAEDVDVLLDEAGRALRAVHRRARRRHPRRDGRGPPGLGPRRDRPARTSGSSPSSAPLLAGGDRAQRRRGGVRGPVPAGARVAYLPVPGPAAALRRCCPNAGPAPPRPASSTGTPPGCGRPPTGTSSSASTPATGSARQKGR